MGNTYLKLYFTIKAKNIIRQVGAGALLVGGIIAVVLFAIVATITVTTTHSYDASYLGWFMVGALLWFAFIGPNTTQLPSQMEDVTWVYSAPYTLRQIAFACVLWKTFVRTGLWILTSMIVFLISDMIHGQLYDASQVMQRMLFGMIIITSATVWQVGMACTRGTRWTAKSVAALSAIGLVMLLCGFLSSKIMHYPIPVFENVSRIAVDITGPMGGGSWGIAMPFWLAIALMGASLIVFTPSQRVKERIVLDALYWEQFRLNNPFQKRANSKVKSSWTGGARLEAEKAFLWFEFAVLRHYQLRFLVQFLLSLIGMFVLAKISDVLLYIYPVFVSLSVAMRGWFAGIHRHLTTGDLLVLPGSLRRKVCYSELPEIIIMTGSYVFVAVTGAISAGWSTQQTLSFVYFGLCLLVMIYGIRIRSVTYLVSAAKERDTIAYLFRFCRELIMASLFLLLIRQVFVLIDFQHPSLWYTSGFMLGITEFLLGIRQLGQVTKERVFNWKFWTISSALVVSIIASVVGDYEIHHVRQPAIDGIQCNAMEYAKYHVHAHLDIYVNGVHKTLPALIGMSESGRCLYWLHTHDTSGVIHVESPGRTNFTLGEFFDVWYKPLNEHEIASWKTQKGTHVMAFVNGQLYKGNIRDIPLRSHEEITLEIGPKWVTPPDHYDFPKGL